MRSQPTEASPLGVLDSTSNVRALLPPLRRRILEGLRQPNSATGIARELGLPRQKVNYHLRELESAGLVELVERRRRRGCTERRLRATARAFVLSPSFLGGLTADPERLRDRLSSAYLMAVASRTLGEVAVLRKRAEAVSKRLVTMTIETEVSFATPGDLAEFAEELGNHVARLAAKYHRPGTEGSRRYRFSVGGYPAITKSREQAEAEEARHRSRNPEDGTEPGEH